MNNYILTYSEEKFADIIWDNEPLRSGTLVSMCGDILNWKKSTVYTVLKKLCDNGIFENNDSVVRSKISRKDYYAMRSISFVENNFSGSLPNFITAFVGMKKLSQSEIDELQRLIDNYKEE